MGRSPDARVGTGLPYSELMTAAAEADAIDLQSSALPDRQALGAFIGAVVIGGSNFVAIRFSNRELAPLWGAGLRFALAAAVFGILVAALRLSLPRGRALALVAAYGVLAFGGAYGCLYWAMQEIPAGVAAVVLAVGPLVTLLLAVGHRMEHLSGRAVAGAVVALVGSALIFLEPGSIDFGWGSFALLGLAALCASESVVVSKLAGRHHPVAMNFVGMSLGAAVLLAGAGLAGERLVLPANADTQLAVAYLVAATVGLFLLVLVVVQRWTASATSYIFVLMPVVAITLGAVIADEGIAITTVAGGAVVALGVWLGAARRTR
jgi:drug/metabolite transporter (DMT)-like permease